MGFTAGGEFKAAIVEARKINATVLLGLFYCYFVLLFFFFFNDDDYNYLLLLLLSLLLLLL